MNGFGFIEYEDAMDARDVVPGKLRYYSPRWQTLTSATAFREYSYPPACIEMCLHEQMAQPSTAREWPFNSLVVLVHVMKASVEADLGTTFSETLVPDALNFEWRSMDFRKRPVGRFVPLLPSLGAATIFPPCFAATSTDAWREQCDSSLFVAKPYHPLPSIFLLPWTCYFVVHFVLARDLAMFLKIHLPCHNFTNYCQDFNLHWPSSSRTSRTLLANPV